MAVVSDVTIRLRVDMGDFEKAVSSIEQNVGKNLMPVKQGLDSISSTMTKVSGAIVGFGTDSYNAFADFERGMSKVSALGGIVGEPLDEIRQKAMDLGASTEFTSREVVDAFQAMALAGWEQADMMEAIGSTLDLATISGQDFGNTTSYIINALSPFGKTASEAKDVVDLFAKTATSANFNINDLAKSFEYVAPIAGSMGYEIEDVNVALAVLANNGLKGSKAGTSLRKILTDLNSTAEDGVISFDTFSVAISDAETGAMRPLLDVMKDMATGFEGLTESEKASTAEMLAGKTGMAGFLAIMQAGTAGIEEMTGKVYDYEGASESMAETVRGDAMGSIESLNSAFEAVKIKIGSALDVAVRPFIDGLTSLARWFANLPEPIINVVIAIGGMVVAFTAIVAVVATCIGLWTAFTMVMGTALLPIIAVIAGIVGLGAVLVYLWNTHEQFRTAVIAIWDNIKVLIMAVCDQIKAFWDTWGQSILAVGTAIWNTIKEVITVVMEVIAGVIKAVTGAISGDWSMVWEGMSSAVGAIFRGIVNIITNILNGLFSVVGTLVSKIANGVKDKFKAVTEFMSNPFEKGKELIGKAIDKIKSFLNFKWEFPKLKMPHFSISGSANPLKWIEEGVPKLSVDWYAKGGVFSGKQIIGVGESGDEAVVPLSNRTKVRPFAQAVASEMGGSGAGGGLTVNVGELVVREEADVRKVAQELYRLQQFKSRGRGSW